MGNNLISLVVRNDLNNQVEDNLWLEIISQLLGYGEDGHVADTHSILGSRGTYSRNQTDQM